MRIQCWCQALQIDSFLGTQLCEQEQYWAPLNCRLLNNMEHGFIEASPEEGNEDDRGAEAPVLRRQAEKAGSIPSGEEKPLGRPYSTFQYLMGTSNKAGEGQFTRVSEAKQGQPRQVTATHDGGVGYLLAHGKWTSPPYSVVQEMAPSLTSAESISTVNKRQNKVEWYMEYP
ncbi:hypothetical protein WISP_138528 [Willisornis vidua]|uniref:Uncharacterized protein n=1 Tax=Willisornis vidua TaxID=1566151 RepID=A0ABQ9CT32_9PASS|nr:hypothetical protein WISP_138528 [Willisornis vidua]